MKKSLAFFLAFLIPVIAVAGEQDVANSWMGKNQRQLIMEWGPPHDVANDGGGGSILIYDFGRTVRGTGTNINPTYGGGYRIQRDPDITRVEVWQFYVNNEGEIYHVRWQSNRAALQAYFVILLVLLGVALVGLANAG